MAWDLEAGDEADLLQTVLLQSIVSPYTGSQVLPAFPVYKALGFVLGNGLHPTNPGAYVQISAAGLSVRAAAQPLGAATPWPPLPQMVALPILANPFAPISFVVTDLTGVGTFTTGVTLEVFGLTYVPAIGPAPTILTRSDGRPHPIGTNAADTTANNATVALVAAPGAGKRIHLLSAWVSTAAAGGDASILATLGGTTSALLRLVSSAGVGDSDVWPAGILCDTNTQIGLRSFNAQAIAGGVVYDVVNA